MALYELLMRISDNPMVALNHAVAVAMTRGAHAGLDLLGNLEADERIAGDHRLHTVRAHLLEMLGDSYQAAAERTASLPKQRYLHALPPRPSRPPNRRQVSPLPPSGTPGRWSAERSSRLRRDGAGSMTCRVSREGVRHRIPLSSAPSPCGSSRRIGPRGRLCEVRLATLPRQGSGQSTAGHGDRRERCELNPGCRCFLYCGVAGVLDFRQSGSAQCGAV
jgi:hypothetical protein